jgi:hypothetical protein
MLAAPKIIKAVTEVANKLSLLDAAGNLVEDAVHSADRWPDGRGQGLRLRDSGRFGKQAAYIGFSPPTSIDYLPVCVVGDCRGYDFQYRHSFRPNLPKSESPVIWPGKTECGTVVNAHRGRSSEANENRKRIADFNRPPLQFVYY